MRLILTLLLLYSVLGFSKGIDVHTYIPQQAAQHFDLIRQEVHRLMPDYNYDWYVAALIEQESCISLTHSRCWNSHSRLKTKREEGAGLGQLTRAWKNGKLRFDSLTEMKRRYRDELDELKWASVYDRPDLQIRAIILMHKLNYGRLYMIKDPWIRTQMADAAYNGGLKGVMVERSVCGLRKGCDPNIWFNNVENNCRKSRKILYGNRSACDINREHVYNVTQLRAPKYILEFIKSKKP